MSLPDDDPVYTLKKVMENLDFSGLLANYSDKGRIWYNPIMMYAVITYANMRGILNRQTRSIQTEGHFGDIKENENFRRFNYRSADKVYKEFMLYAIGRNINKYCRFLNEKLKKFEGKTTEKTA